MLAVHGSLAMCALFTYSLVLFIIYYYDVLLCLVGTHRISEVSHLSNNCVKTKNIRLKV